MEYKQIIEDIDKCIDELVELRDTIEDDALRLSQHYNRREQKTCYGIYGRIDGSKALIKRVRLYVHNKLIKYTRMDEQYDWIIRQNRKYKIDQMTPKENNNE